MGNGDISLDAESVLVYLLSTRTAVERTLRAIRDTCQLSDVRRAQRAISELTEIGYLIDLGDNTYELSAPGNRYARKLHQDNYQPLTVNNIHQQIHQMKGGHLMGLQDNTITPVQENKSDSDTHETMRRLRHSLPNANSHPLRSHPVDGSSEVNDSFVQSVRYLLAFSFPKDALPIPILNQDILGRSRRASICLTHDEHISGEHCRFEIKRRNGSREFDLFIEDLKSRNGTLVDDVELSPGLHLLTHGSRIEVGSTVLIVVQIPY